jgi:type IV secretion system protein TrbL
MAAVTPETANELMVVFSNTVSAGFNALQGAVNGVFGLMIALVVALTGIQWALSANRDVLATGFGKVLLIGLFAYIINDWHTLSETLFAGFIELGLVAGGSALTREDFLNPGAVLHQGWEIVKALGETPAPVANPIDVAGNLVDALILGLAMIGIMLAFGILAIQIVVTLLEFKIVTLGGFVLLPFGIWSKSAFLAERPLGYVVSSGLKVLALAIVVSGARTVFDQLQPSANPDLYEALAILVAAILLAMLSLFIPNLASALVTGGPALGAGAAVTGALAVGGAGGLLAAGAAGAGGAVAGAAGRVSGPARAAAGAGAGRSPSPPTGPSAGPRPSPDNPSPRGPAPTGGGATGPAFGVAKPTAAWTGRSPTAPASTSGGEADAARSTAAPAQDSSPGRPRPTARIAAEANVAHGDFRAALAAERGDATPWPRVSRPSGRSAAFATYVAANSGRTLFPSGETSGSVSPQLKSEES